MRRLQPEQERLDLIASPSYAMLNGAARTTTGFAQRVRPFPLTTVCDSVRITVDRYCSRAVVSTYASP